MSDISIEHLKGLASEFVTLCHTSNFIAIKQKAAEIYECSVALEYVRSNNLAEKTVENPTENIRTFSGFVNQNTNSSFRANNNSVETPQHIANEVQSSNVFEQQSKPQELYKPNSINVDQRINVDPKPVYTPNVLGTISAKDEFKGAVSVDVTVGMFEKSKKVEPKKTLNDRLGQKELQIDLNDRLAFIKHLFDGNVGNYDKVVSLINTFKTEQQAKTFLESRVMTYYKWHDKEDYARRFMKLVEFKFL